MPSELGLTSLAWSTDSRTILQERLSFSAATKLNFDNGNIPANYKVLQPDKNDGTDSPFRLEEGSGYDESSTTSSSPLSYTKELTSVSSPLTPLSDARRSKSKSPSQLAATKSKFLVDDDDEENGDTFDNSRDSNRVRSISNGKSDTDNNNGQLSPCSSNHFIGPQFPEILKTNPAKTSITTNDSVKNSAKSNNISMGNNGSTDKERTPTSTFLAAPVRSKMTIKIGNEKMSTLELSMSRNSLVPYVSESSSDDENEEEEKVKVKGQTPVKERPPSPRTIIGPLKPQSREIKPSIMQKRVAENVSTPPTTKRKRLLSERGENEMAYPVMDKNIISSWNWIGFHQLSGRLRGMSLYNGSNDCFLNAILQLITHTAPLCRYLVERHPSQCSRPSGTCVACSFTSNHFKRIITNNSTYYTSWIKPHLRRIFPSHDPGAQEDAHELLSLLLDAFDPPPTRNNGVINGVNMKPSTPIEQIFGGTLRNQVTCDYCNHIHTFYERIRELNLAVKKRQDSDKTKISYLIEQYFRDENVSSFECKKCSRKTTATRKTKILRPPAVLLIQLKRFNAYGNKIRLPVASEIDIDIGSFMSEAAPKNCTQYVLTAVVEHLGTTIDHGHYVAYCRGFDHKQWYHFDDDSVQVTTNQDVVQNSNPYILVYSRREDMPFHQVKKVEQGYSGYGTMAGAQKVNNGYKLNGCNGNGNLSRQPYRYIIP